MIIGIVLWHGGIIIVIIWQRDVHDSLASLF